MTAYLGDFAEDATLVFKFNTMGQDFAPITLGSGAVAVYKQGSTTESTAGVTLVADYDSVTGLHQVTIDTSADAFYETGKDYTVVLSAGTADSVSLVGRQLRQFSIRNRTVYAYDSSGNAIPTATQNAAAIDKTGYKLASDGLDSIATTAPAGPASNFREMMVQLWRRFFKKTHLDIANGTLKTYADDGSTVVTTQAVTTSSTDEDVGAAS